MQKYVLGFAFDSESVLLIEKTKPEWQKGHYNGVGGKVEDYDATFYRSMVREFFEETNIETSEWQWHRYCTMKGKDWEVYVFYNTTSDISKAKTMTEESVAVISINDILLKKIKCISNLPWLISYAIDFDASGNIGELEVNYN